jgi:hypothetical protein
MELPTSTKKYPSTAGTRHSKGLFTIRRIARSSHVYSQTALDQQTTWDHHNVRANRQSKKGEPEAVLLHVQGPASTLHCLSHPSKAIQPLAAILASRRSTGRLLTQTPCCIPPINTDTDTPCLPALLSVKLLIAHAANLIPC